MPEVKPAFLVGPLRTPTGAKGGLYTGVKPEHLGVTLAKEIVNETGLDPKSIDELFVGCATQTGEQGCNLASRIGEIAFGPYIHATTINDLCGSSAQATRLAQAQISSGENDVVLVLGVENNHRVFQGQDLMPASKTLGGNLKNLRRIVSMGKSVVKLSLPQGYSLLEMGAYGDAIATSRGYSRKMLDEYGFFSQMKAARAMQDGRFKDEIVIVRTPKGYLDFDEGIRPDTSLEVLGKKLKPSFGRFGLHTAATSSQVSGGAAGYLVVSEQALKKHDLVPMARIVASAVVKTNSQKPEEHLIGPIDAVRKVLAKANMKIGDIDLFEINEAFASVALATIEELGIDPQKVNVNGGAIALGHPLGASGARLPVTLLHEMHKRAEEGLPSRYGLETLCIGGGQAIAIIFERV
jgi:acetyl-CoA acetyltransferase family protein